MKIKVCPDFESTGLWNEDETMAEYEDIFVPNELIAKFKDWIDFYDKKCHDYNYNFLEGSEEELNHRGVELAKELKKANPMLDIEYVGEAPECMLEPIVIDNLSR